MIFVERSAVHAKELEKLRQDYPSRAGAIDIQCSEANTAIKKLCDRDWRFRRAVMFLDPYGMQVTWNTIEAIARTKAIDLWILFPAAIGVNRLLPRDAQIPAGWKHRLDQIFGTPDWHSRFYRDNTEVDLFGERTTSKKVATVDGIGAYFNQRLGTVFPKVANNPLQLRTPDGRPLYLLCFAAANENGAKTAIKIAQDILR